MPKHLALLLSAAALALGAAACGGSSSSSSSTAAAASSPAAASPSAGTPSSGRSSHIAIAANPGGALTFDKTSLTATAGKVTITFTNKASESHNFTLRSSAGQTVGATPTFSGGSRTLTVTLKPGRYTYLCTVPGHAEGGMTGTLTVT